MAKIEEIMDQLQTLTLLEAAELVEKIEETFGVDASAGGGMMMMPGAAAGGGDAADAARKVCGVHVARRVTEAAAGQSQTAEKSCRWWRHGG